MKMRIYRDEPEEKPILFALTEDADGLYLDIVDYEGENRYRLLRITNNGQLKLLHDVNVNGIQVDAKGRIVIFQE